MTFRKNWVSFILACPVERTPPGPINRARTAMKWMKRTARLRIKES
jgi:hypothetical protein